MPEGVGIETVECGLAEGGRAMAVACLWQGRWMGNVVSCEHTAGDNGALVAESGWEQERCEAVVVVGIFSV